jgi:voltage-gated potassium channel
MIERILQELQLDHLFGTDRQVVLVDEDLSELPAELQRLNVRFVRGNPTRDETLKRAAIDQAAHAVILSKNPGDPASDNLNVSIALAIEGRSRKVNTVVECMDPATEELLRKTGCDRIVCTSRFGANFMSQELLNPGVQEIIHDLLSSKNGQQLYIVAFDGADTTFGEIADLCRKHGHLALGINSGSGASINPGKELKVRAGDTVITVGPARIATLRYD